LSPPLQPSPRTHTPLCKRTACSCDKGRRPRGPRGVDGRPAPLTQPGRGQRHRRPRRGGDRPPAPAGHGAAAAPISRRIAGAFNARTALCPARCMRPSGTRPNPWPDTAHRLPASRRHAPTPGGRGAFLYALRRRETPFTPLPQQWRGVPRCCWWQRRSRCWRATRVRNARRIRLNSARGRRAGWPVRGPRRGAQRAAPRGATAPPAAASDARVPARAPRRPLQPPAAERPALAMTPSGARPTTSGRWRRRRVRAAADPGGRGGEGAAVCVAPDARPPLLYPHILTQTNPNPPLNPTARQTPSCAARCGTWTGASAASGAPSACRRRPRAAAAVRRRLLGPRAALNLLPTTLAPRSAAPAGTRSPRPEVLTHPPFPP
jgi:hypothetical protein